MSKTDKLNDNNLLNFIVKGRTSIFIGAYFLICGYLIDYVLSGFLIDGNPLAFMSPQIIEILIFSVVFLLFIFGSLALFFEGKRNAKHKGIKLWNKKSKSAFYIYSIGCILIFFILLFINSQGYINYITPCFFALYAILLFYFKSSTNKNYLILPGICLLLAVINFLIPTYWFTSLLILGVAHITYGIIEKK